MSIYAYFESLVIPCTPEEIKKGKYQKHIPSWCFFFFFFLKSYTDDDVFTSCDKSQILKDDNDLAKNVVTSLMFTIRTNIEKFKRKTGKLPSHTYPHIFS